MAKIDHEALDTEGLTDEAEYRNRRQAYEDLPPADQIAHQRWLQDRQRELKQAQALTSRQRWLLIAVSAILVLALGSGLYIYGQRQELADTNVQLESEKLNAENAAVAAQTAEAKAVVQQATAEANAARAQQAEATAVANVERASQQLARLEGLRLYQEAGRLKAAGKVAEAMTAYRQAAAADPSLNIDLALEEIDVRRQAALLLVRAGEALARNGDLAGAAANYQAALDLNPPLDTPVYVRVKAGEFTMGSKTTDQDAQASEQPQHSVAVDEFWILHTEVTNWQYGECVKDDQCEPPDNNRWDRPQLRNWPVTNVRWRHANAYARWMGGRLPSEAEWEKACRGTDTRIYPWGDELPTRTLANFNFYEGMVTDVGSYPNGASPYGLLDMAGNVWEWTGSLYQDYPYRAADGREDLSGGNYNHRTLRGGSFGDGAINVRCAARLDSHPSSGNYSVGFRVVSPGF